MQKRNILETLLAKFPEDLDAVLEYTSQFDDETVYPLSELDFQEDFAEYLLK